MISAILLLLVTVPGTSVRYHQMTTDSSVFRLADSLAREATIADRVAEWDRREGNGEGCRAGMVRVRGRMQDPRVTTARQNLACEDPNWNPRFLCNRFDPSRLSPTAAAFPLDFCIDRFEYPNIPGEYPGVMFSWNDADAACRAQGKRLCGENEWTFACEGPAALPYPHGYDRYPAPGARFPDRIDTAGACNIDVIRKGLRLDARRLVADRYGPGAVEQVRDLWHGDRAGARPGCVSPFGVHDLTGNVEEWVRGGPGDGSSPRASVLKGGYWFPVESRCQPANVAHGPGHFYYQTGFRCCADPRD